MTKVGESLKRVAILGALEESCTIYQQELQSNEQAYDYLIKRGITDTSISRFRIGYAPNNPHFVSNERFVEEFGYSMSTLVESGLVIDNSDDPQKTKFSDRFRGRITIPVFDMDGKVISFTARVFRDNPGQMKEAEKFGKYVNGPQTEVYEKGKTL